MKRRFTSIIALLALGGGDVLGGPSEDALRVGNEAFDKKDYTSALTTWLNAYNERATANTAIDETCAQLLERASNLMSLIPGNSKPAAAAMEKLLALRETLSGKEHMDTLTVKSKLSVQLANSGEDLERAQILAQEAATGFEKAGPDFFYQHLQALVNVGGILLIKKDRLAANEVFSAVTTLGTGSSKKVMDLVSSAYNSMAEIALFFGRSADRILYKKKSAEAIIAHSGANSPAAYAARIEVAEVLTASGDGKAARAAYEDILVDLGRANVGEDKILQQRWVLALYRLSSLETTLGDQGRAYGLLRSALEHGRIGFGDLDVNMLPIYLDLAKMHLKRGLLGEGVKCYQRVLDIRRRELGPDDPNTQETQKMLNELYDEVRKAEAKK